MDFGRRGTVERATRQDDAEAALIALHREEKRAQLRAAALLATIDSTYHYAYRGCSSIAQFGEMHGRSARETRTLVAVGKAVELVPALEEKILSGKISVDAAAALSKVFENPALVRDGDDWLKMAEQWSAKQLELEIRKRMREVESGEGVSVLSAVLTASGREKFERARQLACRKNSRVLDEGETVEVLSDHYLDSFDPARKKPRPRRMADTAGRSGRGIAADVERKVVERHGDRCPVPRCDHEIWLDRAHVIPHRDGGSREAENLVYLCRQHHVLYDLGILKMKGTPEQPVFFTPEREETAREPP